MLAFIGGILLLFSPTLAPGLSSLFPDCILDLVLLASGIRLSMCCCFFLPPFSHTTVRETSDECHIFHMTNGMEQNLYKTRTEYAIIWIWQSKHYMN